MAACVNYPCYGTGKPREMSASAIRFVAQEMRRRMTGYSAKPVRIETLIERTRRLNVNGRDLTIMWDIGHAVHDGDGRPVFGVCEYDPAEPGVVMISLNADLLADAPELQRSSALHELGHAIFDMPFAIAAGKRRGFGARNAGALDTAPQAEWSEWRADEFMGGFLTPRDRLAKALAREGELHGAAIRWRLQQTIPTPRIDAARAGPDRMDAITSELAAQFGVTDSFMAVRLRKYGFVEGETHGVRA